MANSLTSQNKHVVRLNTVLGEDALIIDNVEINQVMSLGFTFSLRVFSDYKHDLQPQDLVGTPLTIALMDDGDEPRYFNGWITQLEKSNPADTGEHTVYLIKASSFLHFMEHDSDCRIFQEKTVEDVISEIMQKYKNVGKFKLVLRKNHAVKRYWVQYNESNLSFFNRICAESGLAYYFTHTNGHHCLNILDDPLLLPKLDPEVVFYQPGTHARDHLTHWQRSSRYFTGNYAQTSYNYQTPFSPLNAQSSVQNDLAKVPHTYLTEKYYYSEQYDNSAGATANTDNQLNSTTAENSLVIGSGDCRFLKVGYQFTAEPVPVERFFPDRGKSFSLTQLTMKISNKGEIHVDFEAVPNGEMIYPKNSRPSIASLQTAVVTGPPGEEIYTDDLGRVKVQFHWDRLGKKNENTTCWMRVMQNFAGPSFGTHFTPRIGQEVVVAFENGNPDRPFIMGGLYHAEHAPPYADQRGTRAGIRTRSTKGGSASNCNELYFEDKKGSEEVYFQAEKNHNVLVKNDQALKIQNNKSQQVGKNETNKVGENYTINVGKKLLIEAGQEIKLQVGGSTVTISSDKIDISSGLVDINGGKINLN